MGRHRFSAAARKRLPENSSVGDFGDGKSGTGDHRICRSGVPAGRKDYGAGVDHAADALPAEGPRKDHSRTPAACRKSGDEGEI